MQTVKHIMCTPDELLTRIKKAAYSEFLSDLECKDIEIEDVVEVSVTVGVTVYMNKELDRVETDTGG